MKKNRKQEHRNGGGGGQTLGRDKGALTPTGMRPQMNREMRATGMSKMQTPTRKPGIFQATTQPLSTIGYGKYMGTGFTKNIGFTCKGGYRMTKHFRHSGVTLQACCRENTM